MNSRILLPSIWAFSVAVTLSACQFNIILPDGQLSIMSKESSRLRAQLAITSTAPLGMPLIYHPVESCSFREVRMLYYETPTDSLVKLSVRAVDKRLQVVLDRDKGAMSNYLISNRGKLYDFNAIDLSTSEQVTPDNYKAVSQQKLIKMKALLESHYTSPSHTSPHPINEFSLVIPEYTAISLGTETRAALIPSIDGIPRAGYEYRGTTFFDGVRAGVFDLVRYHPMNPLYGPPVIGFSIVDLSTTLPLLVVLDSSGFKYEFKRVSCTG